MPDRTQVEPKRPRPKLPRKTEAAILVSSRRRCAICFGLNRDAEIKQGQIAHLDRNRSNHELANLAFLCLNHHDQYDSRTSQSKGFTIAEVKCYRAELEEALHFSRVVGKRLHENHVRTLEWQGVFRRESANAEAELRIVKSEANEYSVSGLALWGPRAPYGPHTGELDSVATLRSDQLVVSNRNYELCLTRTSSGLVARETVRAGPVFGLNVTFEGCYGHVPMGGEALLQPKMSRFESEFWPEEGRPVFATRSDRLAVHSRPDFEAPVIGYFSKEPGSRIEYSGIRYRTLRPGRVIVHEECQLAGRNLGPTDYVSHSNYYDDGGEMITVQLQPNDRLEYLQYRAEGSGFVRWHGLVLDVDYLPWLECDRPLELIVGPVAEGWIRVSGEVGMPEGWIHVDEDLTLTEVGRRF